MFSSAELESSLDTLLKALCSSSHPVSKETLDALVASTLANVNTAGKQTEWEYVLKKNVLDHAATVDMALTSDGVRYYATLYDRLDVVLTLAEQEICDESVPLSILEDLCEVHTIESCVHIFSWLELRRERLTVGIKGQRGKGLLLLRTLNDLLRRVSKTGSTTTFCGRILNLLSNVFPICERSAVNLRGEYGPPWEGVLVVEPTTGPMEDVQKTTLAPAVTDVQEELTPKPTPPRTDAEKKFYENFWSLQAPFAQPQLFAQPATMVNFKAAVDAVLPIMAETTKKERVLMGSRNAPTAVKRKRGEGEADNGLTEDSGTGSKYFFTKYLTSPELLDFEMTDTQFRRQVLFQLLILLQHLLSFTKTEKAKWQTPRNTSLHMNFTLDDADAKWVKDTWSTVMAELRVTAPSGKLVHESVLALLQCEKGWVRWKNNACAPFDKPPQDPTEEIEATAKRQKIIATPEPWKHTLGTSGLTEVWALGLRSIQDLEDPMLADDVKQFAKMIKVEGQRMELTRRRQAAMRPKRAAPIPVEAVSEGTVDVVMAAPESASMATAGVAGLPPRPKSAALSPLKNVEAAEKEKVAPPPKPTPPPPPPIPTPTPTPVKDPLAEAFEEKKTSLSWRALRIAARDGQLHHFAKIGLGDIDMLITEMSTKRATPVPKKRESSPSTAPTVPLPEKDKGATGEGDVHMAV